VRIREMHEAKIGLRRRVLHCAVLCDCVGRGAAV
jgi:hypothetical protein